MSIKRYEVNGSSSVFEDESGSLVDYQDYSALEAKCAALAADNAALKAFGGKLGDMHNDLNGEGTGIQGRAEVAIQQVALQAAMEEFDAIKTTATDAFLAEVRAISLEDFADVMADSGHYDAANYATKQAHKIRQEAAQ